MFRFASRRSGFTAIELLLAIGLITVSAGMSVPVYRQYLIRSDLEIARQNISQGIQRAKFLSQVAMNDSAWGFSTDALPGRGVLFMGDAFATREPEFDEEYSIPPTIAVAGLTEVRFEKISGRPVESGTITLTALNGEQRTIAVNIGDDGTVSIPEDWIEICVDPYGTEPRTISVPDSLWEIYEAQGATIGACGAAPDEEEAASSSSSAPSGEDPEFDIDGDTVTPTEDFSCEIRVLGAAIASGSSDLPVTMQVKIAGWKDPFGSWNLPVDANVNDDDVHVYDCSELYDAGTVIDIRAKSWEKKSWWYSGNSNTHWTGIMSQSTDVPSNDFVWALRDGDAIPDVPGMANQSSIQDFVAGYINLSTGTVELGENQVIYLFELGTTNLESSAADFQDLVVLLTITES